MADSRAEVEEGSSWEEEEEELELSELDDSVEVVAAGADWVVVELAWTGLLDEGD